jgi:hypothetical protein
LTPLTGGWKNGVKSRRGKSLPSRSPEPEGGATLGKGAGLFLLLLLLGTGASFAAASTPPAPSLPDLLRGMDRASYLYLDTALRFACSESIVEWTLGERRVHKYEYMFIFDKERGFQDYRMVVHKGQRRQVSPVAEGVRLFLERTYMWVLIFNRSRAEKYRYRILETDTVYGIPAVQVRFEPIPPYKVGFNDWIGTAWVDPSTFQILKVEATTTGDMEEKNRMEEDAKKLEISTGEGPGRSYRVEEVTTEFTVVKNGMRFPGTAKILSTLYYLPRRPQSLRPEMISENHSTQSYAKYRFYGVRTSEEVRQILSPSGKAKRP